MERRHVQDYTPQLPVRTLLSSDRRVALRSSPSPSLPVSARRPRLLDQVRAAIRVKHYSIRIEESYINWIRRFILFHGKQHPAEMGEPEVGQFLSHLTVKGKVAASTQNQALSALLFLYRTVLGQELGRVEDVARAKAPV